jgi:hypothetical protein
MSSSALCSTLIQIASAEKKQRLDAFRQVARRTWLDLLAERSVLTMNWLHLVSYFFGGLFLANVVPHFVSGVMGKPFQTPFAKPPGKGLSSSTVNVLWGFANFIFAYLLLLRVGHFDPRSIACIAPFAAGALLISLQLARHFGQFHGGNAPERP